MNSKTEVMEKCLCEANLFYQKYKHKIETLLDRKLVDMMGSETDFSGMTPSEIMKGVKSVKILSKTKTGYYDIDYYSFIESIAEAEGEEELEKLPTVKMESELYRYGLPYKLTQEYIGAYEKLLDEKLKELMKLGEYPGEEEMISERGYYKFERISTEAESEIKSIEYPFQVEELEEEVAEIKELKPLTYDTETRAKRYLEQHKIHELFRFLGSHLVAANPENPIDFLINLLESCLNYRSHIGPPPLLFTSKHINSLFDSMDPMHIGFITLNQYHTGMFTLGILNYDKYPKLNHFEMVSKSKFRKEAIRSLSIQLDEMIQIVESSCSAILWPSMTKTTKTLVTSDYTQSQRM